MATNAMRALGYITVLFVVTACGRPYVEPTGIPDEQLAIVKGPMEKIDGGSLTQIRVLGLIPAKEVRVLPGAHGFVFANGNEGVGLSLQLDAGTRYEFDLKGYLNGSRLIMHNVTANRKTFLDPMRWVFYDETNTVIPRPRGPYAP